MSPRRFGGWEPRRETTYHYDHDGRLLRAVTVVDEEWDDRERSWAQALLEYEADLCPGCHQPLSETTKPEHQEAYHVEQAVRCHRCTAADQAATLYRDSPQRAALLYPIRLKLPEVNDG